LQALLGLAASPLLARSIGAFANAPNNLKLQSFSQRTEIGTTLVMTSIPAEREPP
jgi:hypothetical protein